MPKFDDVLEEHGIKTDGVITFSDSRPYEDAEWTVFTVIYEFSHENKKFTNKLDFLICTAHVDWANVGGLRGHDKIDFNSKDVHRALSEGTKISVVYLPENPDTNAAIFDEIIYIASQID